jgi:hypothetical protein
MIKDLDLVKETDHGSFMFKCIKHSVWKYFYINDTYFMPCEYCGEEICKYYTEVLCQIYLKKLEMEKAKRLKDDEAK